MAIVGLIAMAAQPSSITNQPLSPSLVATSPGGVTPNEALALIRGQSRQS
ncbi:MAG: hypothetical protein HC922_02045, partial [Leptolyngbyaceae cyanobacterium SM2_3_12]|nr:hypothetical protein [Leptolyngbyaceae cyanobacterium SM2_3_12]